MSQRVKELDPQHLVALGVIGRGQPGTAGSDFERLHALPSLDMVTYHDYPRRGRAAARRPHRRGRLPAGGRLELEQRDVSIIARAELGGPLATSCPRTATGSRLAASV